jgi:NTE family protein
MPKESPKELARAYEGVALVLQGGGALGAYQAGVFEALAADDIAPTWVAGVSIGAINAALIAGNPPKQRIAALEEFWNAIASPPPWGPLQRVVDQFAAIGDTRTVLNQMSASFTALQGQPGFFKPRVPPPWLRRPGTVEATSFYDTEPLRETLSRLIDFDQLNSGAIRLSLGAVNVETGNYACFDSAKQRITVDHVMASGALPPGFPWVEIDGVRYWDGGVVSNTPLLAVLDERPRHNMLVFQVDLWSARGKLPEDILAVNERIKDITYSSRTRLNTDTFEYEQSLRNNIQSLLEKLPKALQNEPEVAILREAACPALINIIHLIYQTKNFERDSRDYEFSEVSMTEHWQAGREDATRTLRHTDWLQMPSARSGTVTHDLHRL